MTMSGLFSLRTPFENIMRNLIRYAYLLENKVDDQDNQVAEIGYYGTKVQSRVLWTYGLSGLAPRGSTMFNMIVNGQSQNNASIPTYPQARHKEMKEWEFATGNYKTKAETFYDEAGNLNILAPNGNVNIVCDKDVIINCKKLTITATEGATITADTDIIGDVTTTGTLMNNGVNVGSTHGHEYIKPLHPDGNANTGVPQ